MHEKEDNWRNDVAGRDDDNVCTKAEICEIRERATFLCYAYQLALEKMNDWLWHDCCKEACKLLNTFGMKQATFYKPSRSGILSLGSSKHSRTQTCSFSAVNDLFHVCSKRIRVQRSRLLHSA